MTGRRRPIRRLSQRLGHRSIAAIGMVALLGSLGTVLATLSLHESSKGRAERALTAKQQIVVHTIDAEIARYRAALADIAAAVGAQTQIEAFEFDAITTPVTRRRLPGATAISLVVPASARDLGRVQAYWRKHGSENLTVRPSPNVTSHLFVVLSRPLDGSEPTVGIDAGGAPEPSQALTIARSSREIAASPTYRLLIDADLPADQRQWSFVLAAPVFATSPSADVGEFRGWVVMGLRGGDFLRDAIGRVADQQARVELSEPGSHVSVATWDPAVPIDESLTPRRSRISAPQREWQLTIQPTRDLVPVTEDRLAAASILVGGIITLLLAMLTGSVVTSRDRAVRRVAEATVALHDDIERREEVERRLRQREQELVGFAGIVAHDLRSPLSSVSAYAEILSQEAAADLDEEHRQLLDRLRNSTTRMGSLIDDLLSYATADNATLRLTEIDLAAMMREVITERAATGGAATPFVHAGDLPHVLGDPTLIRQVLDNLVGNGIKYTPVGQTPEVRVSCHPDGPSRYRIEVADRGIGIPESDRTAVFDAFCRAPGSKGFQGTGLGLAIVRRVVEKHGGTVGVTDNPGGGSLFWFTLPAAGPASLPTQPPSELETTAAR